MTWRLDRSCSGGLALVAALALGGCTRFEEEPERRAAHAVDADTLKIGVAWRPRVAGRAHFWEGVQLGAKEVNEAGGLLGRKVEVVYADDNGLLRDARQVAQDFADDLDVMAVIGHPDQEIAMTASVLYEYTGLLMVSSGPANRRLNRDGFSHLLRVVPNAEVIGLGLADFSWARGDRRVAIVHQDDEYGRSLANAFESGAEQHRVRVVRRLSYDGPGAVFTRGARALAATQVDSVLVAARMPEGRHLLEILSEQGMRTQLLGALGMDGVDLIDLPEAQGMVLGSLFHPRVELPEAVRFVERYEKEFEGKAPNVWSAVGYDAVKLIGHGAQLAQSVVPFRIAESLRNFKDGFVGATGIVRLDKRGERSGASLIFKRVGPDGYEMVEADLEGGPISAGGKGVKGLEPAGEGDGGEEKAEDGEEPGSTKKGRKKR